MLALGGTGLIGPLGTKVVGVVGESRKGKRENEKVPYLKRRCQGFVVLVLSGICLLVLGRVVLLGTRLRLLWDGCRLVGAMG